MTPGPRTDGVLTKQSKFQSFHGYANDMQKKKRTVHVKRERYIIRGYRSIYPRLLVWTRTGLGGVSLYSACKLTALLQVVYSGVYIFGGQTTFLYYFIPFFFCTHIS